MAMMVVVVYCVLRTAHDMCSVYGAYGVRCTMMLMTMWDDDDDGAWFVVYGVWFMVYGV